MKTDKKLINYLVKTNEFNYQIDKALEELSELQTALLQYKNKPLILNNGKNRKQDVIDELGDVKIRMKILIEIFGKKEVKERYFFKLNKFKKFISEGKYIGKI